ncbi:MAG: hypothetical protein PHT40_03265 [Patescibacteria group bacterium]|nr:hypothetical protein [Patescibacteria group bacterium]
MFSKKPENLSNEELLWKIYKSTERTRRYILWGRVISFVYFLLIAIPIILAIIYLPPMLENILAPYKEFLNSGSSVSGAAGDKLNNLLKDNNLNLNQLLEMYKK